MTARAPLIGRPALALLLAVAPLVIWRYAHPHSCLALAAPALSVVLLTAILRERLILRRRITAEAYFREATWIRRLLSGVLWPTLVAAASAIALTTALYLDVATMGATVFATLVGAGVATIAVAWLMARALDPMLRPRPAPIVARGWSAWGATLVTAPALIAAKLYSPLPAFADPAFGAMLDKAVAENRSLCPYIDEALGLAALQDAASWWLILANSATLGASEGGGLAWLAWLLFLAIDSLIAFAFCRLVTGIATPDPRPE